MSAHRATARRRPVRAPTKKRAARSVGVTLITGATGFLGRHLVELLAARGGAVRLRALVRHSSLHLERAGVDVVVGDVCDREACDRALRGVETVYHVAGMVSRDSADGPAMYRLHVDGTRVLLASAAAAGVRRVLVVSTSGTIGVSRDPDAVATEEVRYPHSVVSRWPYYLSKIYQEQTALAAGRGGGPEVVVVNPSLLLGPGDDRGSSTGDVERVVRGRVPFVPAGGGVSFVDARDAAAGCVLAMERGRPGERYLLSAANMTLEAYLGRVARLAQVPAPRVVDAPGALRFATRVLGVAFKPLGLTVPVDETSLEMARHTWYVDATKARQQLGWQPRDPQETLADTVRDIRQRHHLNTE